MKILIIDDDLTIRNLYEYSLQEAGHETFSACDGTDALNKIKAQRPDFMIVDIAMPQMNGWEFIIKLNFLKTQIPNLSDIPYIVMTGENFLSQNKSFGFEKDRNFCGYFEKMTPVEEVINFINKKLGI